MSSFLIYFLIIINIHLINCSKISSNYSTKISPEHFENIFEEDFSFSLLNEAKINSKILFNKFDEISKKKIGKIKPQINKQSAVKLKAYQFNSDLTRDKFFPVSAAAYGNEENIRKCLNKTFINYELINFTKVYCNGHESQICSGFVALSHDDKAIILSFRGTNSFTQLLLESSEIACKSQTEVNIGGKVATYFTEIYEQLRAEGIITCVINLIKIYTDYELWVTGHSLGGALASLAAAEIVSSRLINAQNIKLLTLGQPRTGNWVWAAAMDQILPYYNYRVVNHRDVIAHLPMRFFEGYHHYSTEIWYNNGMDGDEDGNEDTFIVCNDMDEDDDNCSNSLWQLKIFLKNNYFIYF